MSNLLDTREDEIKDHNPTFVKKIILSSASSIKQSKLKSPMKKIRSPIKRQNDSVTSFRGLLDRDISDTSMMHLQSENGYESSGAQMSMST